MLQFILSVGKWYVVWFGARKSSVRFTPLRPISSRAILIK
ncbi:hypothetical protein LAh6_58 [Aeromonas phage LAh_6]|uniref:Uncharacterized protein n=1 Tax=Aeromonas phage LAh_6 TaxID=2591030 RepID=A0A514A027_9CAUD|nr:hypothetical protein HWC30_gp058 [Aeromonas phage LAh_6]QDH46634.1 hypothetical protein LAh6_58 [Aeromonas phage LAh_6]